MAAKKTTVSLTPIVQKVRRASSTQVLYVALLLLVFTVGYLFAKVQMLEKGGSTLLAAQQGGTAQQAVAGDQAAAPAAPLIVEDLDTGDLPVKGDENASVTIVEFSDFECPFCAQFYRDTWPKIKSEYIDTGKVKLYYRHYPLSFHPSAHKLAVASECANEQGMFWEMHDKIFDNQAAGDFADDTITSWAGELGMDTTSFAACLASTKYDEKIKSDTADGTTAGVDGTPAFFINGERLVGAQPFESFKAVIDSKL